MLKNKYPIVVLIALLICSLNITCTDLDEEPFDVITADQIGDSEDVLNALAAPSYTRLRDVLNGWHGYWDLVNESSDLIVTAGRINGGWVDGGVYKRLHMHSWNSTQAQPNNLWNRSYGALNILNSTLATTEADPALTKTTAEFKALRAFYYYLLLDNFGNVPLVLTNDIEEGFLPEQASRTEVFNYIVDELNSVLPELDEEVSGETYGKMTKWSALMILARVYQNAEVYTGQPKWNEAIAAADQIINSGKFSLEPDYFNNFLSNNEGSNEQIFSIPYDENLGGWHHHHWKALHPDVASGTFLLGRRSWNGSGAVPQFIDTYDPDDKRLDTWLKGLQFDINGNPLYNSQTPELRDVQINHENIMGNIDATLEPYGYRFLKYQIEVGSVGPLTNDVPFFRYADALMIKAEGLLRTGNAEAAAALVTQVRMRAFGDPSKATVTGADLLKGSSYNYGNYEEGVMLTEEGGDDIEYGRFLDELAWEFVGEFHRRQDLIRFNVFTTKSWFSHVPNGEHRKLFAIPESAISSNPNLQQNPGY